MISKQSEDCQIAVAPASACRDPDKSVISDKNWKWWWVSLSIDAVLSRMEGGVSEESVACGYGAPTKHKDKYVNALKFALPCFYEESSRTE